MSLQLFSDILQREVNGHLRKLERKSLDTVPSRLHSEAGGSYPASPTGSAQASHMPTTAGIPPERMAELRHLAEKMSENLLHRLAKHSSEWGVEDVQEKERRAREKEAAACRRRRKSEAVVRLEQEVRNLEAQLEEKRRESSKCQEDLIAKCKAEFATVLNAKENEILEVQRSVVFDKDSIGEGTGHHAAEQLKSEFAEHVRLTEQSLDQAKLAMQALDTKKKGLEKIEAIQRRAPYNAIEELLAQCGPKSTQGPNVDGDSEDDEECSRLWEAIQKGEQVAKKLRRILA
mmetsp:Transcript_36427/g.77476  ORF Transcript_36427/g.77476 Transcript_36427/m.77476 type:complete len:289 (+) Transcript_36427:95-961(+)